VWIASRSGKNSRGTRATLRDAVELEVGAFAYPMGRKRSRPRSPRGPEPEIGDIEGLELRLHPERRVFEVGDRGQADLVVSNVSTHHVGRFSLRPAALAVLVDESGQVVGGPAPAAIAGTGRSIDLDPGDELKIKVLIGTASYREELGYLLPGSAPTYGSAKASRRTPRRERSARHLNRSRLSRGTAPKCPQTGYGALVVGVRQAVERSQHSQVTSSRSF